MKLLVGDREHLSRGLIALDVWTNDYLQAEGRSATRRAPAAGNAGSSTSRRS